MAGLFFHSLAIYSNKNLPNSITNAKVGSKFCRMLKEPGHTDRVLMYFDASNLPNKCEIIYMHFSQSKIATYFIFCKEFFVLSGLITTAYKKSPGGILIQA